MQKWEYQVVRLSGTDGDMIPLLEAKGKEGWELVSVAVSPVPVNRRTQYLAFLKKPLAG